MPYYRIAIYYGSESEFIIAADNEDDANEYAGELEPEVFISVKEVDAESISIYEVEDDLRSE